MDFEAHYRKLEEVYRTAPVNRTYRPDIRVSDKQSSIRMEVSPDHFHAGKALHGSVYFKMLDDAAFFAANSVVTDYLLLTVSFHIDFVRPVQSGLMTARGDLVQATTSLWYAKASLLNDRGKLLAYGSGTFVKGKVPFSAC